MINIHPAVVHFPIALLTLYAMLECLRFKKLLRQEFWLYLKGICVILGTIGGFIAAAFGDIAAEAYRSTDTMRIIEIHSTWAAITNIIGVLIALLYACTILYRSKIELTFQRLKKIEWILKRADRIVSSPLIPPLAILLLAAVSITGAIGGGIVYGEDADPFVTFVYKFLVN